jgi:protein tyrosine/serine phosphatase
LCGVDNDTIAEEYSLTEEGLGDWLEQLVQNVIHQLGADEESARKMVGAKKENMAATLKMLDEEFGGAEGYLQKQCGFSGDEVKRLKSLLIVDEKPVL